MSAKGAARPRRGQLRSRRSSPIITSPKAVDSRRRMCTIVSNHCTLRLVRAAPADLAVCGAVILSAFAPRKHVLLRSKSRHYARWLISDNSVEVGASRQAASLNSPRKGRCIKTFCLKSLATRARCACRAVSGYYTRVYKLPRPHSRRRKSAGAYPRFAVVRFAGDRRRLSWP
jgi:hypothetical protein